MYDPLAWTAEVIYALRCKYLQYDGRHKPHLFPSANLVFVPDTRDISVPARLW